MKIVGGSAHYWDNVYANHPQLDARVDEAPPRGGWVWRESENIPGWYLGSHWECPEVYQFLFHSGHPEKQSGFGGHAFHLNMEDGSQKTLFGPWHGHAGNIRAAFGLETMEIRLALPNGSMIGGGYLFGLSLASEVAVLASAGAPQPPTGKPDYGQDNHAHCRHFGYALVQTEYGYAPVMVKGQERWGKVLLDPSIQPETRFIGSGEQSVIVRR
jgi:hypothetical protein